MLILNYKCYACTLYLISRFTVVCVCFYIYVCVSRFRRSWLYCSNKRLFSPRSWSHSSKKHFTTWSCCQRWTPAVWRPHTRGIGQLLLDLCNHYHHHRSNPELCKLLHCKRFEALNETLEIESCGEREKNKAKLVVVFLLGVFFVCLCLCMCVTLGKWCGYHRCGTGGVGVYAT